MLTEKILEYKDISIKCLLIENDNILKIQSSFDGITVDFKVFENAKCTFEVLSENDSEQLHDLLYDIYLAKLG